MNQWKVVALAVATLVAGASCGLRRVPTSTFERLPFERRVELLEAENELAVAVDRRDQATAEFARVRDQVRRAKGRLAAAEDEVDAAAEPTSIEIARLAVAEAQARLQYLYAHSDVAWREEQLADVALTCAFARYELAKAEIAKKVKLEGNEDFALEDFQQQAQSCDEHYREVREELKADSSRADDLKKNWDAHRAALAKRTFDARASPYVE